MNSREEHHFGITRRIEIDAAHRVPDHKSKCFNIHGHRYVIEAQLQGPTLTGEQTGMVMDFSFVKQCMMEIIHDPCDHGLILHVNDPMLPGLMGQHYGVLGLTQCILAGKTFDDLPGLKFYLMNDVPTAENLAKVWYEQLTWRIAGFFERNEMGQPPKLVALDVWETPNCVARYPFGRAK